MVRLTDLIGLPVETDEGQRLGRLGDAVVRVVGHSPPAVVGLLIRQEGEDLFLPIARAGQFSIAPSRLLLQGQPRIDPFERRPQEVLLVADLLDGVVIDLRQPRVVRVNDIILEGSVARWILSGMDIGPSALLYRLLPRAFRRPAAPRLLPWADLELLASELPEGILSPDHRRLARLHPADIARIADAVPVRQATEIVAALDLEIAADTMEEMIDEKQADVVERLDPERAADILERMAPDAAADVLAELDPDEVDTVLRRMDPVEAAEAHALLTYSKHTAGGLMTTDYVIAPADLRVGEAVRYLHPQLIKPDWVYYIYVVRDEEERILLGVFSLRDLLLADPAQPVSALTHGAVRQVGADTPAANVAQIMSDYNLLALPVTDEQGRLLGIVSVDDALEVILPPALRRRMPRVFS